MPDIASDVSNLDELIRWQSIEAEQHLRLLQDHMTATIPAPCPPGESCKRKHLNVLAGYGGETLPIAYTDNVRAMFRSLASEATQLHEVECLRLRLGAEDDSSEAVADWARGWSKRLEPFIVNVSAAVRGEPVVCKTCEQTQQHLRLVEDAVRDRLGIPVGGPTSNVIVEGSTHPSEKDIKEKVVALTHEFKTGGFVTMPDIKKKALGQLLGRTLHLIAKYGDVSYKQKLIDTVDKSKFSKAENEMMEKPLDQWDITSRYTFLADVVLGGGLIAASQMGYAGKHADLIADAGINMATNLEDVLINKLMAKSGQVEPTLPGYSMPQQFRINMGQPQSARVSPNMGRAGVEALPGM